MKEPKIPLIDLVMCLSNAMDFIDTAVVDHHKKVAYVAYALSREMGLSAVCQKELVLAGALHDIGAFSLRDRLQIVRFEFEDPHKHAELGYAILSLFGPLTNIANMVRFHHVCWEKRDLNARKKQEIPLGAHILHLADRVAVLLNRKQEVLGQVRKITKIIRENSGRKFMPETVEAFMGLAPKEYFWLDLASPSIQLTLSRSMNSLDSNLNTADLLGFAQLFSRIIDFKTPFTARHSSGVASSAELLARLSGFSEVEANMMRIAGYLHDLGKLAVPVEILDKPARLARNEFDVVRHHTFFTYRILETVPDLHTVNAWASFHHERLDGSGYPFHLVRKDLPLGSQIMAVADVFTALTEDRPYRDGMTMDRAVSVLDKMARSSALNADLVDLLKQNFDEIDSTRIKAQSSAEKYYKGMKKMQNQ